MKAIVVVLVAVSLVAVYGDESEGMHEHMKQMRENMEACISETGIDPSIIENIKKGDFSVVDEKLGCFANCMMKKCGVMNENGDIDVEAARAKVSSKIPKEEVDRIIDACQNVGGTGCEKGLNLVKCFWENKKIAFTH